MIPPNFCFALIWICVVYRRVAFICVVNSCTNKSFQIWMSHVTHWCVISHMNARLSHTNETCHVWMSRVKYEWVMAHINQTCHVWMRHVTYECVQVTHECDRNTNESCHIRVRHVTHECIMSRMNARSSYTTWDMTHADKTCHAQMSHDVYK